MSPCFLPSRRTRSDEILDRFSLLSVTVGTACTKATCYVTFTGTPSDFYGALDPNPPVWTIDQSTGLLSATTLGVPVIVVQEDVTGDLRGYAAGSVGPGTVVTFSESNRRLVPLNLPTDVCMARCRAHLEHYPVVFVVATGAREEGEEEEGRHGQGNRGWTRGRGLYFVFLVV